MIVTSSWAKFVDCSYSNKSLAEATPLGFVSSHWPIMERYSSSTFGLQAFDNAFFAGRVVGALLIKSLSEEMVLSGNAAGTEGFTEPITAGLEKKASWCRCVPSSR